MCVPCLLLVLLPQGALDNMNLFQVITIMAFFMLLPVSILFEGLPCLPAKMAAAVRPPEAHLQLVASWLALTSVHNFCQWCCCAVSLHRCLLSASMLVSGVAMCL